MSKFNIIPAGYRFIITTSENDGDNSKTLIKDGISEKKAEFLGELCSLMSDNGCGLENNYEPSEKEKNKAFTILIPYFEKYSELFDLKDMELYRKDVAEMVCYINENIIGNPSEGYYMSALNNVTIEYIPEEIKIEDITSRFIKD